MANSEEGAIDRSVALPLLWQRISVVTGVTTLPRVLIGAEVEGLIS